MPNKKGSGLSFKKFWLPLFLFAVAVIIFYKVVDRLPQIFATIFDFFPNSPSPGLRPTG